MDISCTQSCTGSMRSPAALCKDAAMCAALFGRAGAARPCVSCCLLAFKGDRIRLSPVCAAALQLTSVKAPNSIVSRYNRSGGLGRFCKRGDYTCAAPRYTVSCCSRLDYGMERMLPGSYRPDS